jgi:hypothetical protein
MDRFLVSKLFEFQAYLIEGEAIENISDCPTCWCQSHYARNRTAQLLLDVCMKMFREDACTPEQWQVIQSANESVQSLVFPADSKPKIK